MSLVLLHERHTPLSDIGRRATVDSSHVSANQDEGRLADRSRHPLSRWYVCPLAEAAARRLAPTSVRPWHVSWLGLGWAVVAVLLLVARVELAPAAALAIWLSWFCDRVDGALARAQGTTSGWGAWLDANLDELVDIGLYAALAAAIPTEATWPWWLLAAFVAGKHLFFYGLHAEAELAATHLAHGRERGSAASVGCRTSQGPRACGPPKRWQLARKLYHLPGNADLRVHGLLLALCLGWLWAPLLAMAAYFNMRWLARYVLVARRWSSEA